MKITFYRFEKWFFDIQTEGKDYLIIFFSLIKFMGFRLCYLVVDNGSFENKDPDFEIYRTKLKIIKRNGGTFLTDKGRINIGKDSSIFDLTSEDMSLKINITSQSSISPGIPGLLIRRNKWQWLNWKPLVLKYRIAGNIKIRNVNLSVQGKGYADYLTSTFQPLKVPVKTLYWGRIHCDHFDLTYSYAEGKEKDASWGAMIYHSDNLSRQLDILHLEPGDFKILGASGISCPSSYYMRAENGTIGISLEVRHLKPAIVSTFTDIPKKSGRIGRSMLKKLLRNPRGGKFFSSARIEIAESGNKKIFDQLFMIDEYVKFSEDAN